MTIYAVSLVHSDQLVGETWVRFDMDLDGVVAWPTQPHTLAMSDAVQANPEASPPPTTKAPNGETVTPVTTDKPAGTTGPSRACYSCGAPDHAAGVDDITITMGCDIFFATERLGLGKKLPTWF